LALLFNKPSYILTVTIFYNQWLLIVGASNPQEKRSG